MSKIMSFTRHVMVEYKTLLMKISTNDNANVNFDLHCDV